MLTTVDRRTLLKLTSKAMLCLAGASGVSIASRPVMSAQKKASDFFVEVASGVFVHQGAHAPNMTQDNKGDISNCGFIVGRDAIAVIDTGGSAKFGAILKQNIRAHSQLPIRFVVNTHMHPDHVFGNISFQAENTAFVAHHKLARGLAARAERYISVNKKTMGEEAFAGTEVVLPTKPVEDKTTLDLGDRRVELIPLKTAHTDNDLIIHDITSDTMFMGDIIFSGHTPTLDGSIVGWLEQLETLKRKPAARIVPGHGPASLPWPDAAAPMERYFSTLAKEIRAILARDGSLREAIATVGQSEKDAWELFSEYHSRNVSAAFAELEWE